MPPRKVTSLLHTFDVDPTHETVVDAYRSMARKIRDNTDHFAEKLLAAYKTQSGADPIQAKELKFFIDCGVWPEEFIVKNHLRTLGTLAELREEAKNYIAADGGPG